jgi:hypothetical protein
MPPSDFRSDAERALAERYCLVLIRAAKTLRALVDGEWPRAYRQELYRARVFFRSLCAVLDRTAERLEEATDALHARADRLEQLRAEIEREPVEQPVEPRKLRELPVELRGAPSSDYLRGLALFQRLLWEFAEEHRLKQAMSEAPGRRKLALEHAFPRFDDVLVLVVRPLDDVPEWTDDERLAAVETARVLEGFCVFLSSAGDEEDHGGEPCEDLVLK